MVKRGLIILSVVCLFFITSVYAQKKNLEINDLTNRKLSPKSLSNLQWMGHSDDFTWVADGALVKVSARASNPDKRDTLIKLDELNQQMVRMGYDKLKDFPSVRWKDNSNFTFIVKFKLFQFDMASKTLKLLNQWDEKALNTDIHYGTGLVAYTIENNLFIAGNNKTLQVTSDSGKGIVNGCERVHRNEWGIDKGTFWSPMGSFLAFYRMDETMVADYPLVNIDTPIATVENTKYPMAGETSHQVTIGVYEVSTHKTVFLKTGEPKDQFLTNIAWSPDEKYIFIAVLNRAQDHMKMNQYDAATGNFIKTLFEEKNDRYVEPLTPMVFLKKNPRLFLWESQRDGYNHLYLYDIDGNLIRQLTKGEWVVTSTLGSDEEERRVYFMGTRESPLEKQLYETDLKTGNITRLTSVPGNHYTYVNSTGNYFIDQYSSVTQPTEYQVYNSKGKTLFTLLKGDNPLKDYKLGETTLFTLKADDGTLLYARIIKPVNFDSAKKYPVVVYVYGGPHTKLVTNSWLGGAGLYLNYLASTGYVVFTLDNRGSSNRGFAFESIIHRHLGDIEINDQMTGVKYLKSLPYIDSTRMAVEGWSYGGFMTVSLMLKKPGVFKVGICGGPVIDWKYYEVMYGERYMDTPKENPEGYSNASLLNIANQLKGRLLIMHGTMDETVVWQNSLAFIKKCVEAGVNIDYFPYPGHGHGVGGKDRLHLYRKQIQYYKDFL
ncbi:MAG: DPP IV N-terminal domain-containing protein [Bacteroidetes bacterium]|nr:DPP IV N-terminal domain-containing protein [Bacteroidota bacterium]